MRGGRSRVAWEETAAATFYPNFPPLTLISAHTHTASNIGQSTSTLPLILVEANAHRISHFSLHWTHIKSHTGLPLHTFSSLSMNTNLHTWVCAIVRAAHHHKNCSRSLAGLCSNARQSRASRGCCWIILGNFCTCRQN